MAQHNFTVMIPKYILDANTEKYTYKVRAKDKEQALKRAKTEYIAQNNFSTYCWQHATVKNGHDV